MTNRNHAVMPSESAFGPGARSSDPRRGGGGYAGPGGSQDRHGVVVDPTNAVLLDNVGVVLVEPVREGKPQAPALAMTLAGRINKTSERSQILYMFDVDGAAAIITQLLALASRTGPEAFEDLQACITVHMDKLQRDGHL